MKLSIGITTSPRKQPTLQRFLKSFSRAFTSSAYIFAEPNVDKIESNNKWISREEQHGCWKNWIFSLEWLSKEQPEADYYAIFQDDIVFCKNVESYLGSIELPKIFSIFKPKQYLKNEGVWSRQDLGGKLWMAQTMFIKRSLVPSLLRNKLIWKIDGNRQIDNRIGFWAKEIGQGVYYHCPSLCQHIGETSTIWNKPELGVRGWRSADDFVGEDFTLP